MPIYEYECQAETCGHRFEELQRFSDPAIESCPQCSSPVRKLLFPPAVIFKGAGFYATEYGKSRANKNGSSDESATGSASKSDAKAGSGSSGNGNGNGNGSSSSSSSSGTSSTASKDGKSGSST
jgi:putative FmdB family regulatory protein